MCSSESEFTVITHFLLKITCTHSGIAFCASNVSYPIWEEFYSQTSATMTHNLLIVGCSHWNHVVNWCFPPVTFNIKPLWSNGLQVATEAKAVAKYADNKTFFIWIEGWANRAVTRYLQFYLMQLWTVSVINNINQHRNSSHFYQAVSIQNL